VIDQPASPVLPHPDLVPDELTPELRAILDAVPDGVTVQDARGRLVYANDAAARLTGFESAATFLAATPEDVLARFELYDDGDRPFPLGQLPGRLAVGGHTPDPVTLQFVVRATGERRWSVVRATPLRAADGTVTHAVNAFQDITERVLMERALRASEARYRLAAEAAEELDESLDLDKTVAATAALAVPRFADWCVIDLLDGDGSVRRAAVRVADPAREAAAAALLEDPTMPGHCELMGGAMTDGATRRYRAEDLHLARIGCDERHAELLRALDLGSAVVVPLIARGDILGAMALVRGASGPEFSDADVLIAEELGRRAALGIGNAALYRAEEDARRAAEAAAERMQRLQRLTRAVAAAANQTGVARIVCEHACDALGAQGAAFYTLSDDRTTLMAAAMTGYPDEHVRRWQQIPLASPSLLEHVTLSGEDRWVEDLRETAAGRPDVQQAIELTGNVAAVGLALTANGAVVGALALTWSRVRSFTPEERELGRSIADLAGQALERAALADAREALVADLERQRARLTAVLEQMPGGVIIAEAPSGRLVLGNHQVDRIWRHPFVAAAAVGDYDRYVGFHPDGSRVAPEEWPLARAIARGEVVENEEISFRRGDGTIGTMLASAAPIRDRSGEVVAGVVTFTDITERRHAQERERYLAEASRILGSSLDYEETLVRIAELAVPRVADWCGIDLVDDDLRPVRIAVAHSDPTRVDLARRLRERYPPAPDSPYGVAAVIRTGRPELVTDIEPEMLERAAQDEEHLAMLRAVELRSYMCVPLVAGGRVLGAITFVAGESGRRFADDDLRFAEALAARAAAAIENARLFRERIEAQERLEQLAAAEHARAAELVAVIDAMAEAILVCDAGGRVTLANASARALFGNGTRGTYDDIVAIVGDVSEPLPRLGVRAGPVEVPLGTGGDRWLELSTYPVANPRAASAEPPAETIVVLRDVTEARRRMMVRETFVGVLSHELRTPVTTIYGGSKLLAREGLTDDQRRAVFEDIAVESERLHRLVEDVIALNRFGEADGEVGHEPVLLQRIVPGVVQTEQARWPSVRFELQLRPGLPTVEADRTYVEQVVRNLLSNAAKYGGPGTTIRVSIEPDADEVRVRIVDDGPGFPAEEADRLFDLFFRSPTTAASAAGAGIGLFVCARLVGAMGGRIWAIPGPERGAEFGFALRVMADD